MSNMVRSPRSSPPKFDTWQEAVLDFFFGSGAGCIWPFIVIVLFLLYLFVYAPYVERKQQIRYDQERRLIPSVRETDRDLIFTVRLESNISGDKRLEEIPFDLMETYSYEEDTYGCQVSDQSWTDINGIYQKWNNVYGKVLSNSTTISPADRLIPSFLQVSETMAGLERTYMGKCPKVLRAVLTYHVNIVSADNGQYRVEAVKSGNKVSLTAFGITEDENTPSASVYIPLEVLDTALAKPFYYGEVPYSLSVPIYAQPQISSNEDELWNLLDSFDPGGETEVANLRLYPNTIYALQSKTEIMDWLGRNLSVIASSSDAPNLLFTASGRVNDDYIVRGYLSGGGGGGSGDLNGFMLGGGLKLWGFGGGLLGGKINGGFNIDPIQIDGTYLGQTVTIVNVSIYMNTTP